MATYGRQPVFREAAAWALAASHHGAMDRRRFVALALRGGEAKIALHAKKSGEDIDAAEIVTAVAAPPDFFVEPAPHPAFGHPLPAIAGRRWRAAPDEGPRRYPPTLLFSFGASFSPRSMSSGSTLGSWPEKALYISAAGIVPPRESTMSRKRWPFSRVMPPWALNQ